MPLSEQEQRLLDEMERHLMQNDADVVSAQRDGRSLSYRNIVYGTLLVLVGIGGLLAGVVSQLVIIGVLGFVAMLAGVILAVTPSRNGMAKQKKESTPKGSSSGASFMDRMNDRWDKRQGER